MKTKYKKNEVLTAVLFLAPSVLLWLFWFLYPALKSMRLSFYDYSFINPERQKFVGLDNYIRLFQDSAFLDALKHTFILAFVVVAFISVLAFIIAVERYQTPGRSTGTDGSIGNKDIQVTHSRTLSSDRWEASETGQGSGTETRK